MSSGHGNVDQGSSRRDHVAPYTARHPIPTVQKYREQRSDFHNDDSEKRYENPQESQSALQDAVASVKRVFKKEGDDEQIAGDPYPTTNKYNAGANQSQQHNANGRDSPRDTGEQSPPDASSGSQPRRPPAGPKKNDGRQASAQSATEAAVAQSSPREKRKIMKHTRRDDGGREVTDPVTHLPVVIYDSTSKDLKRVPENGPAPGLEHRSQTGLDGATKSQSQLDDETRELHEVHQHMRKVFPPPNFEHAQKKLVRTYQFVLSIGLGSIVLFAIPVLVGSLLLGLKYLGGGETYNNEQYPARIYIPVTATVILSAVIGFAIIWGTREWLGKRVADIWENELWDAARHQELDEINSSEALPESTQWLNSLLSSVWPLINPDLFTGLADTLEDVMQASLPKFVRMVSVNDLGQGSESIRILGVKWLPTGAAASSVDVDGNLKDSKSQDHPNDRNAPGDGQVEQDDQDNTTESRSADEKRPNKQQRQQKEQEHESVSEGLEAEQGDFVNMELAFAYRARSSGKSLKTKSQNAHLFLKFYLPGRIAVPVWVEMRGIIGTMRVRLQLNPDPPFFALATITFLGQPQADLSCVPLSKHSPNLMDVPLISSFVQSSIDAALAEYVAPKSLTLDIKGMLVGDDFKKDTTARGVLVVYIKRAYGFKEGDGNLGPFKAGSSDSYVTCGWAKFGKAVSSTRIILSDQSPVWNEWSYLLVGPEELNAEERLRIQLWDSDRTTADDDLGRVEVDLKDLMHNSRGGMVDRKDRFKQEDLDEKMPGYIEWSVGYFGKTRITEKQLAQQSEEPNIKTVDDLKKKVSQTAERKLREATAQDETKEIEQQKARDFKEREDTLIISSPPSTDRPSGILSIQIHHVTGLELEQLNKPRSNREDGSREDEAEEAEDLPSSFATVILNHAKVFKTRVKPKTSKAYYNAACERFIRDWRTTEVILSVRDSRVRENDPLLGVVYLPLAKLFEKRSQLMDSFPIAGGIGYGRARVSMVFRSVELQAPKELLGWDYGTLEISSPITADSLREDLKSLRIKVRAGLMRAKMQAGHEGWAPKHGKKSVFLAVTRRYSRPLIIEFRKSVLGADSTPAFAVFWLSGIPDEEERTVSIQVWTGGKDRLKRATSCCEYAGSEDDEKPLGSVKVTMKFWRGLSGYHKGVADKGKDQDMRDVMEALSTAEDNKEGESEVGDKNGDSSDSDSSDSADTGRPNGVKSTGQALANGNDDGHPNGLVDKVKSLVDGHNDPDDPSRNPIQQIREYKDNAHRMHRRHRGIMQWKGARTVDWMMTKAIHGKDKFKDSFKHTERGPGVETEV